MMVLMTEATGTVGRKMGEELVRKGVGVRAPARNPEKADLCRTGRWDAE